MKNKDKKRLSDFLEKFFILVVYFHVIMFICGYVTSNNYMVNFTYISFLVNGAAFKVTKELMGKLWSPFFYPFNTLNFYEV